jgi:hypothetical protein
MDFTNQSDREVKKLPAGFQNSSKSGRLFTIQGDGKHKKWKTDSVVLGAKFMVTTKNGSN